MIMPTNRPKYYYKCPNCNGVAYYYNHDPSVGERLLAEYASKKNGQNVDIYEKVRCGTCNSSKDMMKLKNFISNTQSQEKGKT